MDLFFYVVIVIIVILKVIFWVFYFYSRYKRKELQRLISRVRGADMHDHSHYEEQPAMPQPAFMFSTEGRARGPYPMNLPAYAEEDPGKIECPPPPYVPTGEEVLPIVFTEQSEEASDTQPLITTSNQDES